MDEQAAQNRPAPFFDATGVRLEVGLKVAWGAGGKYSFGLVLGYVESLTDEMVPHKTYDYTARTYKEEARRYRAVTVKALLSGRKGRTIGEQDGVFDLVVITNQDYAGNKG